MSRALLAANEDIREAALRFGVGKRSLAWDFMCECGAPGCYRTVRLTLAGYEALREAGQPVIAEGHGVSRAARARRRARDLRADAEALRAQAQHQQGRAKRNLGGSPSRTAASLWGFVSLSRARARLRDGRNGPPEEDS